MTESIDHSIHCWNCIIASYTGDITSTERHDGVTRFNRSKLSTRIRLLSRNCQFSIVTRVIQFQYHTTLHVIVQTQTKNRLLILIRSHIVFYIDGSDTAHSFDIVAKGTEYSVHCRYEIAIAHVGNLNFFSSTDRPT